MNQVQQTPARLPEALRARARDVGQEVLSRLAERAQVIEITVSASKSRTSQPSWTSVDPATGDAGLALAFGYLARIDASERWEACAHTYLVPAVTTMAEAPFQPLGLVAGVTGLAFVVRYLGQGRRHQRVLSQLDAHVNERTRYVLAHTPPEGGVFPDSYDVVYGFSGIGRYLLQAAADNPAAAALLRELLATLVRWSWLAPPQGFWTPPGKARAIDLADAPEKIHGYLTLGLAHGIPGPLALLSLAHETGIVVADLHEAARVLVDTLKRELNQTRWGPDVPYHRFLCDDVPPQGPARAAWCFGNPGVARAVQLAARAFGEAEWFALAEALMTSAMTRPEAAMQVISPTFCHGEAGLVQLLWRFVRDQPAPNPLLCQALERRVERLLAMFDANAPFGYRNRERSGPPCDVPGIISGAAGCALALLSVAGSVPADWDALMMVS
jgi:lantibiotic modifying enzyme